MKQMNRHAFVKRMDQQLEFENERAMAEIKGMLRELLAVCLSKAHRRMVRGQIDLGRYYADTQALACMAERLNNSGG